MQGILDESHVDKHRKHAVELVAVRADTTPAKRSLDLVPLLVQFPIVGPRVAAVPFRVDDKAVAERLREFPAFLSGRRPRSRLTARSLPRPCHPRQPHEALFPSRHATCRLTARRFFCRAVRVGVELDACIVHGEALYPDPDDLLALQGGEHAIQDPTFRPPVRLRVYGVPLAELFRQAPPFAAVFRDVQQRVQELQIAVPDVPPLHWQQGFDPLELFGCYSHALKLAHSTNNVNTL